MTVTLRKRDEDQQWFTDHPDRNAHIRSPVKILDIDKRTHASHVVDECAFEFQSLGDHEKDRRRILLWRVPKDNPAYDARRAPILKLPMLAFADETIEDSDEVLLPIIHELMMDAAKKYGI